MCNNSLMLNVGMNLSCQRDSPHYEWTFQHL